MKETNSIAAKIIIAFFLLFTSVFNNKATIKADDGFSENNSLLSFKQLLELIYTECPEDILVYKDGIDYKENFIQETQQFYSEDHLQKIYDYIGENEIVITKPAFSSAADEEEHDSVNAISTSVYRSADMYAVVQGTSPYNPSVTIKLPINYYITVTVPYDFNTGKITGGLRAPSTVITSTDGVADSWYTSDIQYAASITNGGYSVYYSNISFIVHAGSSLVNQVYNRFYGTPAFTFTPAS